MKTLSTITLLFCSVILSAQSLPFNFETAPATEDFVDFDGGIATVIANPQVDAENSSGMVAQIVRDGGTIWSGSKVTLDQNLDFTNETQMSMKVFTMAPIGTVVKFKLEGGGNYEVDALTTVSGAWETLTWDFTGQPNIFSDVVFMFDFGNVGDGSATSTFLFDDVTQGEGEGFGLLQIDLPVTFEGDEINYTMTDFGGNIHAIVEDPEDVANTACMVVKNDDAELWAGTTISTPLGLATNIPLTLADSKMNVRVWSPASGTPIRLKVEDATDPTHTCETEAITTLAGGWQVLEFDFANEADGTAALSFGLDNGWIYSMASIFFNFGTDGATAGAETYYFDDVEFGPAPVVNIDEIKFQTSVYPNPTVDLIRVMGIKNGSNYQIFDGQGRMVDTGSLEANNTIDVSGMKSGSYILLVLGEDSNEVSRFVKK